MVAALAPVVAVATLKETATPRIVEVAGVEKAPVHEKVPVTRFEDGVAVSRWGYLRLGGDPRGADRLVKTINAAALDAGGIMGRFTLLPDEWVTHTRFSKKPNGVDIDAIIGGQGRVLALLTTMLEVRAGGLARIGVSAHGRKSAWRLWLNGVEIEDYDILRLKKGAYPLIAVATTMPRGKGSADDAKTTVRFCVRLQEIEQKELDALLGWVGELDRATEEAKTAPADKWRSKVEIEPATVRGAEGFFRVGRSKHGHWWLIDPDGDPFFCNAVCSVNGGGLGGRRAFPRRTVKPDDVEAWIKQMKGWGFNTLGSWTTEEFFNRGIAYCEIIETYYEGPYVAGGRYRHGIMPDVFDPAWKKALDEKCAKLCKPRRDDKELLGYFLDNERGFRQLLGYGAWIRDSSPTWKASHSKQFPLLQFCLSRAPDTPACKAAWDWLLKRHEGDIERVGKAWGLSFKSKADLRAVAERGEIIVSEGLQRDQKAFLRLWVNRYYETAIGAIRRHDPNHLILGVRWGGPPSPVVLEEEAKWTDVVSANNYTDVMYERMDRYYRIQQKPILVGEFGDYGDYFSGIPMHIEPEGGVPERVRTVLKLRETMDRTFTHPAVVGWTWYRWHGRLPSEDKIGIYSRAAFRAPFIKADWDRPARVPDEPLHGQVFMFLDGGFVSEEQFNPVKTAAEPAKRTNTGSLRLGFVCRAGKWDDRIFGNVIDGRVLAQRTDGGRVELKIELDKHPGPWSGTRGHGEYEIKLERNAEQLKGVFEGEWDGMPAKGAAFGYVHRGTPNPGL